MNSRIIPSIAILLTFVVFFGYVNPMWIGTIATKNAKIAADDSALVAADDYKSQQGKLVSERDAIDPADLSTLSNFLPDSVDNVGLIINLNTLAARSGLSVSNIDVVMNTANDSTSSTNSSNLVGSVDLSLSADGTFSTFRTFLSSMERSLRILDIQGLTVNGSDTGVYSYQMKVRLYWLR